MMNYLFKIIFLPVFIAIFITVPLFAFAQSSPGSQIYLSTNPEIPQANTPVTISVSYPLADLSRANISWYINSTLASEGVGQTKVLVPMGEVGKRTQVRVSIRTVDGKVVSQSITLTPATVDIVWEALTYTPPLFKGKALPSAGSMLRISALPVFVRNGEVIDPTTLYYTWEVSGRPVATGVRGRTFLEVPFDKNSTRTNVSVFVNTADRTITGKETVSIAEVKPEIVVYEKNPVAGIVYNKAISNESVFPRKTITLVAEPFYVPEKVILGGNSNWNIGGERATVEDEGSVREVVISSQGSTQIIPVEFLISGEGLSGVLKKALTIRL